MGPSCGAEVSPSAAAAAPVPADGVGRARGVSAAAASDSVGRARGRGVSGDASKDFGRIHVYLSRTEPTVPSGYIARKRNYMIIAHAKDPRRAQLSIIYQINDCVRACASERPTCTSG